MVQKRMVECCCCLLLVEQTTIRFAAVAVVAFCAAAVVVMIGYDLEVRSCKNGVLKAMMHEER